MKKKIDKSEIQNPLIEHILPHVSVSHNYIQLTATMYLI